MNITRSETRAVTQFRANMYKHVDQATYKTCWRCGRDFAIGESVNICLTRNYGNFAICTSCAHDAGLLDKVDNRGFVSFEDDTDNDTPKFSTELINEIHQRYLVPDKNYRPYSDYDTGEGYVYFLLAKNGLIKIGSTYDIIARTAQNHKTWQGEFDFVLAWVIETENRATLEIELHKQFRAKKAKCLGEWYILSPEDIEYIKSL